MADIKFEVVQFVQSTAAAGTTQDVTIPGFGTPKGVVFFVSGGENNEVPRGIYHHCIGFTDGVRETYATVASQNNSASTDAARGHHDGACIATISTTGATDSLMSFDSWITDGIRLYIDDASTTAWQITAIFIGGDDVANVYVNVKDDLGTGTSAVPITDPGFEPTIVMMTTIGSATAGISSGSHNILSFGVGVNDGSDTQRVVLTGEKDAQATQWCYGYIGNTDIVGQIYSGTVNWKGAISAYDSVGFSITPNVSTASDIIQYMAIELTGSPNVKLFDTQWNSSGHFLDSDIGFSPTFGLITTLAGPTARNTYTNDKVGLSFSAFDKNNTFTTSGSLKYNGTNTVSYSSSADRFSLLDSADTFGVISDSDNWTMTAKGWDIGLDNNPPATNLAWGLAIGKNEHKPIEVTRFRMSTGAVASTQDITIPGFGNPSGVVFIVNRTIESNVLRNINHICIGAQDGTADRLAYVGAGHNFATSDGARGSRNTAVAGVFSTTTGADQGLASFNSWITDGVRLDIDNVFEESVYVTAIFFDSDCQFHLGEVNMGTSTAEQTASGFGFEPDALLTWGVNYNLSTGTDATFSNFNFGMAVDDSDVGIIQRLSGHSYQSGVTTTQTRMSIRDDYIASQHDVTSNIYNWQVAINSFTTDGFKYQATASTGGDRLYVAAFKLPEGHKVNIFDVDIPTSGVYTETGPQFRPYFGVIDLVGGLTTRNAIDNTDVGAHTISMFNENRVFTTGIFSESGATSTSNERSLSSNKFQMFEYNRADSDEMVADYREFDSVGWTFDFSKYYPSTNIGWGFAAGLLDSADSAGPPPPPPPVDSDVGAHPQILIPDRRLVSPSYIVPKRQPTGDVVIDWGNPMSKGLIRCYMTPSRKGGAVTDLVSGFTSAGVGGGTPVVTNDPELGSVIDMVNTSNSYGLPSIGKELPEGSIYVFSRVNVVTAEDVLFDHMDYPNNHRIYFGWQSANAIYLRLGSGTASALNIPRTRIAGEIESLSVNWAGTSATAYYNGIASTVGYTFSGTPASATNDTKYGYSAASGLSCDHNIAISYVFDRELDASEHLSLHLDPYQLVVPAVNRIFIPEKVSTAGFLSNPIGVTYATVNKIIGVAIANVAKFIGKS